MFNKAPNGNFSDNAETKKYVTPYAFKVDESLLGMRLASPSRRLGAILIDLMLVALLTKLPAFWLAAIILFASLNGLFKLRAKQNKAGVRAALIIAAVLAGLTLAFQTLFISLLKDSNINLPVGEPTATEQQAGGAQALTYRNSEFDDPFELQVLSLTDGAGKALCPSTFQCDARFFDALAKRLIDDGYQYSDATVLFDGVKALLRDNKRLDRSVESTSLSQQLYDRSFSSTHSLVSKGGARNNGVLSWLQGVLSDLGLSFGWAAAYFSILTAWWSGQTVGKKLFGIAVVRIDGKSIDLWEAIGRYGGYSAGLATGLLGFLQVYWDANRQAIQDKISETVVVRPAVVRPAVVRPAVVRPAVVRPAVVRKP